MKYKLFISKRNLCLVMQRYIFFRRNLFPIHIDMIQRCQIPDIILPAAA